MAVGREVAARASLALSVLIATSPVGAESALTRQDIDCADLAVARAMCRITGHDMAMKALQAEVDFIEDSGGLTPSGRARHMNVLFDAHRIAGKNATGMVGVCMRRGAVSETRLRRIGGGVDSVVRPHMKRLRAASPGPNKMERTIAFAETDMRILCRKLLF